MKIRFRDRLINVVRSLYSETLILRLKATLCVVDLRGAQLRSSHKLVPFSEQSRKTRQWNARVSRWELADWKNFVEIYNENETKLTKIHYSFPGLQQPVSKKQAKKAKKKTGHRTSKKIKHIKLGEVILNGNYPTKQNWQYKYTTKHELKHN